MPVLLIVFALFLNLLAPLSHRVAMADSSTTYVEICTQGGIQKVQLDLLDPDQTTEHEECPICADCPVCWMANPTKALLAASDIVRPGTVSAPIISSDPATLRSYRELWSWPESRAPPSLQT